VALFFLLIGLLAALVGVMTRLFEQSDCRGKEEKS
jgi:hypothetical protein